MSVFETLSKINVNDHIETISYRDKRTGRAVSLKYLSWAWAWGEVKKIYPDTYYTVYETPEGCIYWTDGRTCWVKTGVTIEGQELIERLPVMDRYNRSIPLEDVTSMDANTAIQRSLTKAIARHGLGFYIYAGEDLPEQEEPQEEPQKPSKAQLNALFQAMRERGIETTKGLKSLKGISNIEDINMVQYADAVREVNSL